MMVRHTMAAKSLKINHCMVITTIVCLMMKTSQLGRSSDKSRRFKQNLTIKRNINRKFQARERKKRRTKNKRVLKVRNKSAL